jgi:hypothetical protein
MRFKNLSDLNDEIEKRDALGHTLVSWSDPKMRVLGFIDKTTNEELCVGLTAMREPGFKGLRTRILSNPSLL